MEDGLDLEHFGLVALAGGLGALIGLERELQDKPAGLRTHILMCAGCAMLMILGEGILDSFQKQVAPNYIQSDPIRILQAIVIGISFLGSGTIVRTGGNVEGLTTAASIFFTAGIGASVGIARITLAVEATIFAVVVLFVIGKIEQRWLPDKQAAKDR